MTFDQFQALMKYSLILLDEKTENESIDDADLEEWLTLFQEVVHAESERHDKDR